MEYNDKFYLRKACEKDMDLLFEWANDPIVRKNAFHTEPITYEEHREWFQRLMQDESRIQYILMLDNKPIGQIRFDLVKNAAEIDYSIAPEMRGKGYGKKILSLAKGELNKAYPTVHKLIGQVKKENLASKNCFLESGYKETFTQFELSIED